MTRLQRLNLEPLDPLVALENIDSGIALENFNFKTLGNRISDAIPNVTFAMKQILAKSSLGKTDKIQYSFNEKVAEKAVAELQYLKVADVNVFVPRGFQGKMYDYLTLVESAYRFAQETSSQLTSYNQFLSLLISNPDTRSSTQDFTANIKDRQAELQTVKSIMTTFFTSKNHTDRAPLGETFSRSGEILDSMHLLKKIVDTSSKNEAKDVLQLVSDCSALLSAVADGAHENRMSNLSPEALKTLSAMTYSMAYEVEFLGAVHFTLGQLINAMTSNEKLIIQMARYDK